MDHFGEDAGAGTAGVRMRNSSILSWKSDFWNTEER